MFNMLATIVPPADAIRPFILHAHGGVYLDLDSECFADMSPWLQGAQLVMQAEVRRWQELTRCHTVRCKGAIDAVTHLKGTCLTH